MVLDRNGRWSKSWLLDESCAIPIQNTDQNNNKIILKKVSRDQCIQLFLNTKTYLSNLNIKMNVVYEH